MMRIANATFSMTKSGLSKSTRKFIRREKARIRGGALSIEEQKAEVAKLYEKYLPSVKAVGHAPESQKMEPASVKPVAEKKEELSLVKKQAKKVTSEKGSKTAVKKQNTKKETSP